MQAKYSSTRDMLDADGDTTMSLHSRASTATQRPEPGHTEPRRPSSAWRPVALILLTLCLVLVISLAALGLVFFQFYQLSNTQQENISQKEERLGNLSRQLQSLQTQKRKLAETLHHVAENLCRELYNKTGGSRCAGSAAMAHGPSRSASCGVFPDRGTNPHPLHRRADSQPLRHQGSPTMPMLDELCFEHRCSPCPEKWKWHGDRCYKFYEESKSWQGCAYFCIAESATMLKINAREVLEFAMPQSYSEFFYSYWTGLSRNGNGKAWLWMDGAPYSHELFEIIIDFTSLRSRDCVTILNGKAFSKDCKELRRCACERAAATVKLQRLHEPL
ncbi:C-type lectin domain family 1 member A isoform X1 [Monodon monoceros]|uniref:C-type lectin domain family 1 member A isoform X1 n=1 Tax=Monodon monoceros TaxID=40151 RepID=UPI0010F571E3|nr:C-type lectin domain family 1 member A isoform X1 [Monodon monoceros]